MEKNILFKNGEDDFTLWLVDIKENDMRQFYGKGETTRELLDALFDLIPDLSIHPNMINFLFIDPEDDYFGIWIVAAEQQFFKEYTNEGCSERGSRKQIKDVICNIQKQYNKSFYKQYFGLNLDE